MNIDLRVQSSSFSYLEIFPLLPSHVESRDIISFYVRTPGGDECDWPRGRGPGHVFPALDVSHAANFRAETRARGEISVAANGSRSPNLTFLPSGTTSRMSHRSPGVNETGDLGR